MSNEFSREQLFDLYRIAIDEYRFEVRLNWDRSMYYVTFNTAIVATGTGLLKIGTSGIVSLFVAGIFLIGLVSSFVGVLAIRKGHEYYHRSIFKKTLLEDVLGLNTPIKEDPRHTTTLAVGTTRGQSATLQILHDPDWATTGLLRRGSIVFYIAFVLALLAIGDLAGIIAAVKIFLSPPTTPYIPWP